MPGNSFGQIFRITTFGESHGGAVGVVVDGCPAGLEISEKDIQQELDRRKPGQSEITTPRQETDTVEIFSGLFEGKTTGTPIMMMVKNKDPRPQDYKNIKNLYRPSHADFTYDSKYGFRDYRGGGRSSARETVGRVAAGAIAKKFLTEKVGLEILSYVESVGEIKTEINHDDVEFKDIESTIVRCPDSKVSEEMIKKIKEVKSKGDTIGGVICGLIRGNVPVGLGEPVFDKLHADLGKAMLSINAVKGFEIGSGFDGTKMKGSEHNDLFYLDSLENLNGLNESKNSKYSKVRTRTNNSGGVLGGISNGETIYFRVAFKPVATLMMEQDTVGKSSDDSENSEDIVNSKNFNNSKEFHETKIRAFGRHDACVLPRAVPIVDAMSSLVIMDHFLRNKIY